MHVLHWLRNEGSPNLALSMLRAERRTGSIGSVSYLVADHDELRGTIEEEGFRTSSLGWTRHGYLKLFPKFLSVLREQRPAGVVCYAVGPHVAISWACRRAGIPFVLHLGNAPPPGFAARAKIAAQLWAGWPATRAFCACSTYVADAARRAYKLPHKKMMAILNGIDTTSFTALRGGRPRAVAQTWSIVMAGSYESHKDQGTLLEALGRLVERGHDVSLRLAGEGTLAERLDSKAIELDVAERVGFGSVSDVREVLADADVFAYAVNPTEGMGIAMAEALAAGVPVVASDVGACREVLRGGQLGELVAGRDAVEWASALESARGRLPVPEEDLVDFDIDATLRSYRRALGLGR